MSCTRPIPAQSFTCPTTGLPGVKIHPKNGEADLQLNCNKCPSCKLRKAKEWALRCWHESQMHEENAYVTFTYAPEHLPAYENLDHRDFQLFLKRLRKKLAREGRPKFKYFMCGEYGDETHRPHYHAILFGYYPPDAVYHRTQNGNRYYKSQELDKAWQKGFTDTSSVSYYSAGYVARYTLKKQLPKEELQERYLYPDFNGETQVRKFEYNRMSTGDYWGDGIGASWFREHCERTVMEDNVLDPNGNKCPVPGYYLKILKEDDPHWWQKLKDERVAKAQADPDNDPSRLAAKEICTEARLKQLPRPYL